MLVVRLRQRRMAKRMVLSVLLISGNTYDVGRLRMLGEGERELKKNSLPVLTQ